jgi:hypothetical protein
MRQDHRRTGHRGIEKRKRKPRENDLTFDPIE